MKADQIKKLHWTVDLLVTRDGTWFGYGSVFHEELELRDVKLKVRFSNNESRTIAASYGKPRDDVATSFPQFTTAKHSGFFLLGSCSREDEKLENLFLQATLNDGSMFELPILLGDVTFFDQPDSATVGISKRQFIKNIKRSLYLIKRFKIISLLDKARRYFNQKPTSFLKKAEEVLTKLDAKKLQNIILVIDHDLGGGANHYRERMVAEKINEGATVFILSYYIGTLSYVLMVRSKQSNQRFTISGYGFLLELAKVVEIKEIIYNTAVSFARPEELPRLMVQLKNQNPLRLTILLHDFFILCPSHFLLDDTGTYCGIPDMARCRACLVNNQQDFSSLFRSRNIEQWRLLWGEVITIADEIRVFSKDSLKLLQKAYPDLVSSRAVIKPHTATCQNYGTILPTYTNSLRIGVVGQIGYHKGARIVQKLAAEIKDRKLDIRIVVIGTIDVQCEPSVVLETGFYQKDRLPELIKDTGVNILLFPSIWPETFSYVVQELMALDLPAACYALGAPAERLQHYAKGLILNEMSSSATLDNLILFHQRIYLSNRDL